MKNLYLQQWGDAFDIYGSGCQRDLSNSCCPDCEPDRHIETQPTSSRLTHAARRRRNDRSTPITTWIWTCFADRLNIRLPRADKNLVTGAQSNLETGRIAAAQSTVWFLGPMRVCPERHLDRSVRFLQLVRVRRHTDHATCYVRRTRPHLRTACGLRALATRPFVT